MENHEEKSQEEMVKEAVEEAKKAAEEQDSKAEEETDMPDEAADGGAEAAEDCEADAETEEVEAGDADSKEDDKKSGKKLFGKKNKKDKKDEKIEELTHRLTRQMAEFDNFRKRTEKEKSQMYEIGAKDIIEKILPVIDDFERGFGSVEEEDKNDAFVQGMEMVYKKTFLQFCSIDIQNVVSGLLLLGIFCSQKVYHKLLPTEKLHF